MWFAAALMLAPACSCGTDLSSSRGCVDSDSDLHFGSSNQGCGGAGLGSNSACAPDASRRPHVAFAERGLFGECDILCEPGWFHCDGSVDDKGCESNIACSDLAKSDSGDSGVAWLQTLSDAPLGLAVCGSQIVFADGAQLTATDKSGGVTRTLALLDHAPTGGLACDQDYVYVALDASDGGPKDGRVAGIRLKDAGSDANLTWVGAVDPARSLDLDDAGGVYWLTRKDAGTFVTRNTIDASDGLLLPIDEPQIYKTFALHDGVWAIRGGDVRHLYADGAVDLVGDASAVAITSRSSGVSVLTRIDGGAALGDASFPQARAIASWGDDVFVATDTSITHISKSGALAIVVANVAHVVDLAVDDKYVYFTTLGPPSTLSRAPW